MILGFVEVSRESLALAEAEAVSAAEALGGRAGDAYGMTDSLVAVELPDLPSFQTLAGRLALARRCLIPLPAPDGVVSAAATQGGRGGTASFRRIGRPSGGGVDDGILACGRAFKTGGGSIDLDRPTRRFWLAQGPDQAERLLEEVAAIDRVAPTRRRMPLLPFRRPVSLPPKLARAAVNLARVVPGDAVMDPFLGTGALLAEAGLLGGRVYGIDRDPAMVRGSLRNFSYLGVGAEEFVVGDAREVGFSNASIRFSAIVTDTPYGRSSSTGGASVAELIEEVMRRWSERLAPDGRILLIAPAGPAPPELPAQPRYRIPIRVHRSLTREFRLYERARSTSGS